MVKNVEQKSAEILQDSDDFEDYVKRLISFDECPDIFSYSCTVL